MAMDIFSRVAELVENTKEKLTDKDIFLSPIYARFISKKAANVISGSFYTLRKQGFAISKREEDDLLSSLVTRVEYDTNDEAPIAYTTGTSNRENLIWLNSGSCIVQAQDTREEKHYALLGLLYHEIGHLLFTDFPTMKAWLNQMERGAWFPKPPDNISTVNGINLSASMTDETFREILCEIAHSVQNSLEDGYIEREIREMYPVRGTECLSVANDAHLSMATSLDKDVDDGVSPFMSLSKQILLYAKYDEMLLGDYDGELLDTLYECVDILDDVRFERDPLKRVAAVNELLCILYPYMEEEIKEKENQQQQAQNNGQPGAGQSGVPGNSSQSSQNGSGTQQNGGQNNSSGAGNSISQATADAISQAIKKMASQCGVQDSGLGNGQTGKAFNNPGKAQNAGAPEKQAAAGGGADDNGNSTQGAATGNSSLEAAAQELNSIINSIANNAATEKAEKERTSELNKEYGVVDCSDFEVNEKVSVQVTRAANVAESNVRAYDEAAGQIVSASRDLQRSIIHVLKDRREGGKRKNLIFGRRLEISSVVHQDGKYFSKNKLPTESPRLGVGLLIDESGSTNGPLIIAARNAALVIEDFCRELGIPHIISGYTTGRKDAEIISYAEPNEIDASNRYRITGMQARGGTPTKAALAYMLERMRKLPVDIRLLIVVSDGCSGDNMPIATGSKVRQIETMVHAARKNNTIVVAAGIGSDRSSVEAEFGKNFLDVSNIDEMSEQLVELIKENLWV